jgi:hypothetical protein
VKILLWHGYLLGGTGSNVYTRALAREWSEAGHDVVVVCQERHPEQYDLGGARVVRPNIGGVLPVFVLDRYEGLEPKLLQDCTRPELDRYVALNATAISAQAPVDFVFANHVRLSLRREGARVGARVLDARQFRAGGVGERSPAERAGGVRRLGTHPHGAR